MRTNRTNTNIIVNLDTIKTNLSKIKSFIPYQVIAVLKANAYGLGINNILPAIVDQVYKVAINNAEEYFEYKLYSYPRIFMLLFPELNQQIIENITKYSNIEISINSREMLSLVKKIKHKIKAQLEVDSGINRTGIKYTDKIYLPDNVQLTGIYTHLKSDNIQEIMEQLTCFYEFILKNNIDLKNKDIGFLNSSGVMNYHQLMKIEDDRVKYLLQISNNVRIGILMYGVAPSYKYVPIKHQMGIHQSIHMEVSFLGTKMVTRNESIGYTNINNFVANKDYKVGLAFVGYSRIPYCQNLLFDVITNKRRVLCKSLGTMSMDIVAFDVNFLEEDEYISKIYLFSEVLEIEFLAMLNNYTPHLFLTSLGSSRKIYEEVSNYTEV
ncbi:MAG: alanine racemase [bacterium]